MKIAEIVPVSCLNYIEDKDYYMCLAQLVLKNEEYAEFYRKKAKEGKYVILDNGAAEGESLNFDDLYEAYAMIQPTEIILPDVLFDSYETIKRSVIFYQSYMADEECKIMVVPQAESLRKWISCTRDMLDIMPINTIGIPKWLGSKNRLYRVAASGCLAETKKEIHLLGCSESPEVLKMCKEINPNVRGCDSAYAYLCSKANIDRITLNTTRPGGVIDFLNDPKTKSLPKLMKELEDIVK